MGHRQLQQRYLRENRYREDEIFKTRADWTEKRLLIIAELNHIFPIGRFKWSNLLSNERTIKLLCEYFANEADIGVLGRFMRDFHAETTTIEQRCMILDKMERILRRRIPVEPKSQKKVVPPKAEAKVEPEVPADSVDALIMALVAK